MEPQDFINEISQLGEPIELTNRFNLIFWALMAFNLIVFALVRTFNPGYLRLLFRTAFNNRQLINNIREDLNLRGITSLLLNLTYFTSVGIIAWKTTHSDVHDLILILLGAALIGAFIKLITIQLLIFFTTSKIGLQEHFINHLLFFQIGGIILTPILIFTQYIPASYREITLISILILLALIIIIREFQSLTRAIQHKISYFYIILYLCTLELLPLVVGIRVFILYTGVLN
ncbi:MAG: hypothetical protein ACI8ZM_004496 [Crocinitomix sp.]